MNIIVIVIDTLRYDYVGAHGNAWIRTPHMDRLAARSWVYDRSFAASYPTIPHRTDALTGRYGAPFHRWMPLRFDVMTFPEVLAQEGYCTQLIHDTPHLVNGGHNFDWPFHAWTFIRGAEVDRPWIDASSEWPENWARDPLFEFADDRALSHQIIQTYARANRRRTRQEDWNAANLFLTSCEWLRDNAARDRFLLWIDCFDPHEPWDAPPEFMRLYDRTPGYGGHLDPRSFIARNDPNIPQAAKRRVAAEYAAKVSWVDHWLGELLDTLEETGLARHTAILLTADHGTNVGERGRFGKGFPVREQEGHIPFMAHVPDGGSGRSDIIVQPQDIFATVMGLAEVAVPASASSLFDSHDVLACAREGGEGSRGLALAGATADHWQSDLEGEDSEKRVLFTVFDREWCLEFTAKPENCGLVRLGSLEDVAADHPSVVEGLHAAAIDEMEHRGTDPALVGWLRSYGESGFPAACRFWDGYPGPAGFAPYFSRLYLEETTTGI
jgi:arylsulfatase A-like enzyme